MLAHKMWIVHWALLAEVEGASMHEVDVGEQVLLHFCH